MIKRTILHSSFVKILGILLFLGGVAGLPLRAEEPSPSKALYNTFTD